MPKPWEDVHVPSASERWEELNVYLDSMKEELMAEYTEAQRAERFARLEGDKGQQGAAPARDSQPAGGEASGAVLRPGAEEELIKPVDVELEETWQVRPCVLTGQGEPAC